MLNTDKLNNRNALIKMSIESIDFHWSESGIVSGQFKEGSKITDLDKLEKVLMAAAIDVGEGNGYDKTKMTVNFRNGDSFTIRMDLNASETCLYSTIAYYLFD